MVSTRKRRWKLWVIPALVLLALSLTVFTAWAFESRTGNVVIIDADEVIEDDLYVAANEFTLDGTVQGDLIVVGRSIEINGTVTGDLFAAAQSVVLNGTIEDDVRMAGYALVVGGQAADDIIAAGLSLDLQAGANVGGDLAFAGYQARLTGDVAANAKVAAAAVELQGTIGGNVTLHLGDTQAAENMRTGWPYAPGMPAVPMVPVGLTIDPQARITGDLEYTATTETSIPSGAVAGDTEFTRYVPEFDWEEKPAAPSPALRTGLWFLRQLRLLVTLLLVGTVMMGFAPKWTSKLADIVRTRPLPSLGWGLVAIIAFVITMLLLIFATIFLPIVFGLLTLGGVALDLILLGGLVIGATGVGFGLVWSYVTRIAISLLLGQLIFKLFKSPAADHRWLPMLLGVFIFVLITAIPVLRTIAIIATVLLGLGAFWIWAYEGIKGRREASAAAKKS
jgi:cytoskeletal protein CcmA (bactofilin family)